MTEEQATVLIGQMERIIALLDAIREQLKPKEKESPASGPFMEVAE